MTCSLHSKLDAAIAAAKAVFDEAHDKDTLSDSDLNLVFVYYQGLKKIAREYTHTHDDVVTVPDGCIDLDFDPDYNITVGNIDIPDAISWNNEVVTEPLTFNTGDSVTFTNDGTQSAEGNPGTPIVTKKDTV